MATCSCNSAQTPMDLFLRKDDFGDNSYFNKMMRCMRYRLILDRNLILEPCVDYINVDTGGFKIIIPGFTLQSDTIIVIQFY